MRQVSLLIALLLPVTVAAQTTGTVAGTITSTAGGAAVQATVAVQDSLGNFVAGNPSDASGHYSIVVPAGSAYNVLVTAPGFASQLHAGIPCAAADCPRGRGTPVTVTPGATTTVDVALPPEGRISGTVTQTANGLTAADRVQIYNVAGSFVTSSLLGGNGAYTVGTLPAGTYFARTLTDSDAAGWLDELFGGMVCPNAPGYTACRVDLGTPIVVTAGATTSGINFSLDPAGTISGTVTGVGEAVLLGTGVEAYSGSVRVGAAVILDASGQYTIKRLPAGYYTVRTKAETSGGNFNNFQSPPSNLVDQWYTGVCIACTATATSRLGVQVTAGQTTSNINFQLFTGGGISGSVTLGALPSPDSTSPPAVLVYGADGVLIKTFGLASAASPIPWQVAGLPTGTYYVRTSSSVSLRKLFFNPLSPTAGWWVDKLYNNIVCIAEDCTPTRGTPVTVTAGSTTTGINFVSEYGRGVGGSHPATRIPDFATVDIYDARGVRLPGRIGIDLGGHYTAAGLTPGTYYLKLQRDVTNRYPATSYKDIPCNGCSIVSGTPISLGGDADPPSANFGILPSQAIRGTVRSSSAPLSTITVEVFEPNGVLLASAVTAADGVYTVPALNPGTYFVRTVNQRGFIDAGFGDGSCSRCDPLRGTPITVAAGADTTGIDVALNPGTYVSGTLTTQLGSIGGHPMGPPTAGAIGATAVLFFTSGGTFVGRTLTDAFGRYETTLAPGTYQWGVDSPGLSGETGSITIFGSSVVRDGFFFPARALTITPVTLASAAVGAPYRQALSAAGSAPPLRFSVTASLPPGLVLDPASGVMSGTPSQAGQFAFTVTVEDAQHRVGQRDYTLDVPVCTFQVPSQIVAAAAGGSDLFGQTCAGPWTTSADVPWISATRTSSSQLAVTIGANTSSTSRRGSITVGSRAIAVFQSGTTTTPPFGVLETPANGAVLSGSVAISGWALDDLGVARVAIYRDPVAGEGSAQVYLGDATIVTGARPDVEAAFPAIATKARAGWGYLLLTNMLPGQGNGTFNLSAYADDTDGNRVLLGYRTVVVANASATAPFGAIDFPQQGGTVAGASYINWGWALTPQPKLIPFDGSTIDVVIDGVAVGKLTAYDLPRSDVVGLFPGLKNTRGPVGYHAIDTTALSEGMHTIAWVVTDDAGQATGVGSRYFTVQNSAWLGSVTSEVAASQSSTAVPPRIDGIDIARKTASLAALPLDAGGARAIDLRSLQRLELALAAGDESCAADYEGYLIANGELRALPIGSSLDRAGTFYWQPGPGFFGTYRFVFVRTSCDGARTRIPVSVIVR